MFPQYLDDFVTEDNPVRVIEAFVAALDLRVVGFAGVDRCATGRPAYHPAVLLKLYLYGYLNRIQSSRRLELFTEALVAIDGSKFEAVNNRDMTLTAAKMQRRLEQIDASVQRYLAQLGGFAPVSSR